MRHRLSMNTERSLGVDNPPVARGIARAGWEPEILDWMEHRDGTVVYGSCATQAGCSGSGASVAQRRECPASSRTEAGQAPARSGAQRNRPGAAFVQPRSSRTLAAVRMP